MAVFLYLQADSAAGQNRLLLFPGGVSQTILTTAMNSSSYALHYSAQYAGSSGSMSGWITRGSRGMSRIRYRLQMRCRWCSYTTPRHWVVRSAGSTRRRPGKGPCRTEKSAHCCNRRRVGYGAHAEGSICCLTVNPMPSITYSTMVRRNSWRRGLPGIWEPLPTTCLLAQGVHPAIRCRVGMASTRRSMEPIPVAS